MSKEEIEECTEELYAIHKDLADLHKDSIKRLSDIADSNMEVVRKMEQIQKKIASSVHNVKVYNNRFMVALITIFVLVVISAGWKFSIYSSAVEQHLRHTKTAYGFMVEGMVAQKNSLERIEELEKKTVLKNEQIKK
jgi:hypothetical protein